MGYPELPPDGNEMDRTGRIDAGQITTNFNPPTSEDSDNNDPNADSPYSGYQQLTFDGETYSAVALATGGDGSDDEDEDAGEEQTPQILPPTTSAAVTVNYPSDFGEIECAGGGNSFPDVVPVDLEIAQQVWNAPPEPSRSNAIELDDTRTSQIINLMSGISLPQNCIPEWAQNLSEENWKQELLDKIRNDSKKKVTDNTSDCRNK